MGQIVPALWALGARCALSVASGAVPSLELPPDRKAAARARRFVTATLRDWGLDGSVADAELLVSELVTNVVLHTATPATVDIARNDGHVRIGVSDLSPDAPRVRPLDTTAVTGRGMLLVDKVATTWGVEIRAGGKCVWVEVLARRETSETEEGERGDG